MLAVHVSCLEIPASSEIPSCSCNSVTGHFQVLTVFQISQHSPSSLFGSDTPPSLVFRRDPPAFFVPERRRTLLWHQRFQGPLWARRSFRHFSLVLECHATHFANVLALLPSYPDSPNHRLLPCHEVVLFLCCVKKLENITASSRRVLQDVPLRDLFAFWLLRALQGVDVHFCMDAIFPSKSPLLPQPFFPKGSIQLSALPDPLCHCLLLEEADDFSRCGAFSLLWCLSHRERLTTKKALGPSFLKVSNIAQPFPSLASSRMLPKSTSVSCGPIRDYNSSTSNYKNFSLSSKYCFVCAMTVLSFALHIWSSTSKFTCSSSNDEYEFCNGAGGLILLLDNGGAFTRRTALPQKAQSEQQQKPSHLSKLSDH